MQRYNIKHLTLYKGNSKPEEKYRKELSDLLRESFGQGPYSDRDTARATITFCFNYYCDKFLSICHQEKSLRFYQFVLSQHEQSIEAAFFAKEHHFPEGIDLEYVALYRRILKWILEQACDVKLHNQEKSDATFLARATNLLNELVFLGDMMFTFAVLYAEQDMVEDVVEIAFEDNLYVMKHKHHYDYVIQEIQQAYGSHSFKYVVDANPIDDLGAAMEKCFNIKYTYLTTVIAEIHKVNEPKGGQYCGFGWESLPMNVKLMFDGDADQARILFRGLTLDRVNKLKLNDLVCRPQTMNRYLYRPILIWNIEGEDFAIVGKNGFTESIIQLTTNTIPWGKAPEEWMKNECFKDYVHRKEDEHDKWLDDEVENRLKAENLPYLRNITSVESANGTVSLNQKDVGEIDFLIVDQKNKKIVVTDCKHLQSRYDMITQKNDYSNFTKGKKPYNQQIKNKIDWVVANLSSIAFHFEKKQGIKDLTKYTVEGIFIINTPTFYMFNSSYRIYTVDVFADVIMGRLQDPELTVIVNEDGNLKKFNIKYPYFEKPTYQLKDFLKTQDE